MNTTDISLNFFQLFLVFLIPLGVILLGRVITPDTKKDIFKTSLKMVIQLLLIGVLLTILINAVPSFVGSLYVFVMLFFGIKTLKSRTYKIEYKKIIKSAKISMSLGSLILLAYFVLLVIHPNPLFNPSYLIPIYGMVLGNTLTAIVIACNYFDDSLENNKIYIHTLLDMGVDTKVVIDKVYKETYTAAVTPVLTTMSGIGLVSLPGMMTGQILSGTAPFTAVKYQIAIMLVIFGSITISIFLFLYLLKKQIINKYGQLSIETLKEN